MKRQQIRKDRLTRAQLQKLMPGGLQTYLHRMWHASDGIEPIVIMQRRSGILMELHTMDEKEPTFMMTTSGKRSRVTVHDLADTCQALKNWISNTTLHGSITVTWECLQHSWQPTQMDIDEILDDMTFSMPLDSWQESWLQRNPAVLGDDIAEMVLTSASIEMLQKLQVAEREYLAAVAKPEHYGISMKHGQHGLMHNQTCKLIKGLKDKLNHTITSQQAQKTNHVILQNKL